MACSVLLVPVISRARHETCHLAATRKCLLRSVGCSPPNTILLFLLTSVLGPSTSTCQEGEANCNWRHAAMTRLCDTACIYDTDQSEGHHHLQRSTRQHKRFRRYSRYVGVPVLDQLLGLQLAQPCSSIAPSLCCNIHCIATCAEICKNAVQSVYCIARRNQQGHQHCPFGMFCTAVPLVQPSP